MAYKILGYGRGCGSQKHGASNTDSWKSERHYHSRWEGRCDAEHDGGLGGYGRVVSNIHKNSRPMVTFTVSNKVAERPD